MNGDTITVNAPLQDGPRVKRIKIEHATINDNHDRRRSSQEQVYEDGHIEGGLIVRVKTPKLNGHDKDTLAGIDAGVQTQRSAQPVAAEYAALRVQHDGELSTSSTITSLLTIGTSNHEQLSSITPNIDFSSAPSDPIELAWWVAQQIAHFHEERASSPDAETEEHQRRLLSHPPGVHTRHSDAHLDPLQIADKEKLRGENRERKKRWRETNTERSKHYYITFHEFSDF